MNNLEYIKEVKNSQYISYVDKFLYKFIVINIILNIFLYYFSNELIIITAYIFSIILFFINFKGYLKPYFFVLFAQILIISLINLTYLTFVLTALINKFAFDQTMSSLLIEFLYCDIDTYIFANLYLLIFCLSILIFNSFIPRQLIIALMNKINLTNFFYAPKGVSVLMLLCIIFELFFFLTGISGSQQSGGFIIADGEGDDKSTWYTQLYNFVMYFHILLNILFIKSLNQTKVNTLSKIFLVLSFLCNFFFFGFYQRRNIVVFLLINVILYFLVVRKKIFSFKMIILYVMSFFILIQAFTFLGTIRQLNIVDKDMSLIDVISEGEVFLFFKDKNTNELGKETFSNNLQKRLFNNHELATLFYYESSEFLNGRLLFSQFIKVIPSVVYLGKVDYLTQEDLITTKTNSPLYYMDTVDSLQSYSYIDFGFLGLIIYPLIINFVFFIFYKITTIKNLSNLSSIFILALIMELITIRAIETNLTYWFLLIRNFFVFMFFFNFLLSKLDKKNMNI